MKPALTIPRILHCVWVGPRKPPMRTIQTWKDHHPDWKYRLWTNEEVFGRTWQNQAHVDCHKGLKQWSGVADVVRYEILLAHGGAMHGADSRNLHPIDELFLDPAFDAYAVYENEELRPGFIAPLYACTPGNPLAKALIDGLAPAKPGGKPWETTGNLHMARVIGSRKWPTLKMWPSYTLIPWHYADGKRYDGPGKVYAEHLWGTTKGYEGRVP